MQKIYDFHSIIEYLYNIQQKSNNVQRNYGLDIELMTNEIHLLDFINQYPENNLSCYAEKMKMSKMSISSLAKKLERKGLLSIVQGKNHKELKCILSPRGEVAVQTHSSYHKMENIFLTENLSKYTSEDINLVINFLYDYGQYLKIYYNDSTIL